MACVLLADQVRLVIPTNVRQRGESLFQAGAVHGVDISAESVVGRVDDDNGSDYGCEIAFERAGQLAIGCECDHFYDNDFCPHVWALVREADRCFKRSPEQLIRLLQNLGTLRYLGAADEIEGPPAPPLMPPPEPEWKRQLRSIKSHFHYVVPDVSGDTDEGPETTRETRQRRATDRRIAYVVEAGTDYRQQMQVTVRVQRMDADGTWRAPKAHADLESWLASTDPIDIELRDRISPAFAARSYHEKFSLRELPLHPLSLRAVLKPACAAGRCFTRERDAHGRPTLEEKFVPLAWDADVPFAWCVNVEQKPGGEYVVDLQTVRGNERLDERRIGGRAGDYALTREASPRLVRVLGGQQVPAGVIDEFPVTLPASDAAEALEQLLRLPGLPTITDGSALPWPTITLAPSPRLKLSSPGKSDNVLGHVEFAYGGAVVSCASAEQQVLIDTPEGRALLRRDGRAEAAMIRALLAAGAKRGVDRASGRFVIKRKALPSLVLDLVTDGWHVEGEGKVYRPARSMRIDVTSGIDWLDVKVRADFGPGAKASLPAILAAVRKRETTVVLDDGSIGLLPQEWLRKYAPLAGAAAAAGDVVEETTRFPARQSLLLDALLADLPDVSADERFAAAREQLARFASVTPSDAPVTFVGSLRPYQREGLGWLKFLHEFGMGGCLADDMGLGKTIQVLALLDWRRETRAQSPHAPSLVVVPRSLIFNWKAEAAKFAPQLRVLDHSTAGRSKRVDHLQQYDVILTTYGTLRADAELFKDVEFDYVILDEAQAIKNASTANAKAARLLRSRHRLAMSGTPIENHLGELWSLFDFLNPGMFGDSGSFKLLADPTSPDGRAAIARTIRPLLLRRTKSQVATDLPERVEQTIFCDLEPKQRKIYDGLREHYRSLLTSTIATQGIEKSQIQILEALLRLRQAACHPALIDRKHHADGSAKLDLLVSHLAEAIDEGHKVLVFSQFTSLLAILRERLDGAGQAYEYLDGQTRDRQTRVERFQNDPACKLFLISLKAGGVGLNLTAADYVFLLDPWWNPAVEAQAIDRTHRIGQQRTVIATRLIARDTVEEKVLQLQQSKRDLADAIVGEASRLSSAITREDLALLLA